MAVVPVVFDPIYKPKIWGGDLIFTHFGRTKPTDEPIGESWELADLEEDQSKVRGGPMAGRSLADLRDDWGVDLLGDVSLFEGRFPLLIKFLDAQTSLSVQVHPSEAVARKLGGNVRVKNEAWYVLAATPDGVIYHGLEDGVDADTFRKAMETGRVEGVLRKINVKAGECYYLPSGTPHALGAGVLVAEVQTPSDITYRTYDWGRVDPKTGQPRELHLDQAMACIDFDRPSPEPMQPTEHKTRDGTDVTRVTGCESFVIERVCLPVAHEQQVASGEMAVWMVLEGAGQVHTPGADLTVGFGKGDVLLLPAAMPASTVRVVDAMTLLRVTVPVSAA